MSYPNLQNEKIIAIDIETKDTELIKLGPGVRRALHKISDDRILCVSIATRDRAWCFDWNYATLKYLQDTIMDKDWITANGMYDCDWLQYSIGVTTGTIYDILTNESLIDASRNPGQWFSLDYCARKYLKETKQNDPLKKYADNHNIKYKRDVREILWRIYEANPDIVRTYATEDARQTFKVYLAQQKHIDTMNLRTVVNLESKLHKPLLRMRRNGVKFDVNNLEKSNIKVESHIKELQEKCNNLAGFDINVNSGKQMLQAFTTLDLPIEYTPKNNPTFSTDVIEDINAPFVNYVIELRKTKKIQNTFLTGIEKFLVNGYLHTNFIAVKNGSRGTETGRLSSEKPALQQIPKRGEGKKLVRGLFLPEYNMLWEKQDQAAEEFRTFSHYGRGRGAQELRDQFINNPNFDPHSWVKEFCNLDTRDIAKTANFQSMYGGGVHSFCKKTGNKLPPMWRNFTDSWEKDNPDTYENQKRYMIENFYGAEQFFKYHDNLQCIKTTSKAAQTVAKTRGYAKTILGRRRYLTGYKTKDAFSSTNQGTCGDIGKQWLVDCEEKGLWDILPLHLVVHDEIDFSVPDTKEAEDAAKEVKHIGENCIKLKVPLKVDREQGVNWADVKEIA